MSEQTGSVYYYPNKMGRIILQAMEEVVSHVGLSAILNLADLHHRINHYPPNDLDRAYGFDELGLMLATMEILYGPRGGRGLALRTGRACFKYGLREFGPLIGSTDMAFRLLPLESKLRVGAKLFSDVFNRYSDQQVRVDEKEDHFLWHIDRCPVCWKRQADSPICHLAVGVLQEALYWVSGGKYFNVDETLCIAKGDPTCTIVIEKLVIE
jgi:predicted hydrocarbon binding protein